ncbi:MAG TPA: hypothetical protein VLG11_01175 [Candidatus Saccharimonadales bacterium]|nr:hypothetical protein [Candidatus Saccharimonadales bacterium]
MKSPTARVVVITDRRDAHLPFVERHLDAPFVVLDPQEFAAGKELSYECKDGRIIPVYDGLRLDAVSGAWYRKPLQITDDNLPVAPVFKAYARTAMQRHFNQLLTCFSEATWVSDYYAICKANNKSWQLAIAKQLGMQVPDTVITGDKVVAAAFLKTHPRSVAKSLTTTYPQVEGKTNTFFTTLLEDGFAPDLTGLHFAPSIFQEAISISTDVRVTVVGDQIFAAAIRAQGAEKSKTYDYRLSQHAGKVTIEALDDFPKELTRQCVEHTKRLGLRFGALDFVLDASGTYWFLENNPNGQWAFIEESTGQPIGKALADLLQSNALGR